jgi:hypothetical protein
VSDFPITDHTGDSASLQRCTECDVTWWGDLDSQCWFCGTTGVIASETRRVVRDENAA